MLALFLLGIVIPVAPAIAAERLPVPPKAAQDAARREIETQLKKEFADATKSYSERDRLASRLWFGLPNATPAERFMAKRMALELRIEDNWVAALYSADEMAKEYEIDPFLVKASIFRKVEPLKREPVTQLLIRERLESVLNEAVKADAFPAANELAALMISYARKDKDEADALEKKKRLDAFAKAHAAAAAALAAVAAGPADPAMNLAAGRYVALVKRDWEKGLPLLAQGSDAGLKAAAAAEQAPVTMTAEKVARGDRWLALAEAEADPLFKAGLLARARFWYQSSVAELAGLDKTKIQLRLEKMPRESDQLLGGRGRLDEALLAFTFDKPWPPRYPLPPPDPPGKVSGLLRQAGAETKLLATVVGGKSAEGTGRPGTAVYFESAGFLELPEVELGKDFTISFWVRYFDNLGGCALLANRKPTENGLAVVVARDGSLKVEIDEGGKKLASLGWPARTMRHGEYQHVALVVDRTKGQIQIYHDGKPLAKPIAVRGVFRTSGRWNIGAWLDGAAPLHGALDTIAIYPFVLTPAEVKRLSL
jgi:hypothetical protein